MNIIFNIMGGGIENNGGSDTIVRSANTLTELGHEVTIIDTEAPRYTWGPIKARHVVIHCDNNWKYVGNTDVIVATGFGTVRKMLHLPIRYKAMFHWIRGWETWHYPEAYIKSIVLNYPTIKLVNSTQLQNKLASCGLRSQIVIPGYDLDKFSVLDVRDNNEQIILGGLYSEGKKRSGKRTEWIIKTAKQLKKKHNVKLWMYGLHENPHIDIIDRYFTNPTDRQKNEIYNYINIWLAPTELEGLHRPPAEAMLTKCPVVGTNAELSGLSDYLIHGHTGLVSQNNLTDFIRCTEELILSPVTRKMFGYNARQTVLSLGSRQTNMQKMVNVFSQHC